MCQGLDTTRGKEEKAMAGHLREEGTGQFLELYLSPGKKYRWVCDRGTGAFRKLKAQM